MEALPITDSLFLTMESRQKPFHVASLQLYRYPDGAEHDMQEFFRRMLEVEKIRPIYGKRLEYRLSRPHWEEDKELDLEYHVRHSALPRPGRVRELLTLVSRLHGALLDRSRPLWETHLIEGVSENRFAIYAKIHHALVDGVAGMRLVQEALSEDPDETLPPPWADRASFKRRSRREAPSTVGALAAMLDGLGKQAMTIPGIARGLFQMFREASQKDEAVAPYQAPRTILNVPISGARRFAAQSWPIERVRAVGKAGGGTLNDAVLAMCAGALRRYLDEQGALPKEPLIAMVPVSIRPKDTEEHYGNAVSAILCNLATHVEDPLLRLEAIRRSMQIGKSILSGMSREAIANMGVLTAVPMLIGQLLGLDGRTRPAFNVTISNVPGPKTPLYWSGARLEGLYPVSIVTDGQALNITLTSYLDNLEFGLIGCRRSVPHLQRMLGHLEDSLAELERAAGIRSPEVAGS